MCLLTSSHFHIAQHGKTHFSSYRWNFAQTDTKVRSWSKDFVRDKGEGRIFLLHGSPGVGKTCTAECVADLIRRPLLALTCGDMGITAGEVEQNFKSYFELAELWGAVVLMDEADVYLEQRTSENLERNSLVSVFLRALEYFRGVLFLTTNRIGAFDDAFISRIHVALHYKRLSDDYRSKIWDKNFRRLMKEGNIQVSPSTIIYAVNDPDVRAVEWNGREIRNAFQTAVALAQYEARKAGKTEVMLEVEHLRRVVKMSKLFKEYITSTHKNQDEAKRAIIDERRNDAFDSK
jgi:SpoVK/Ycf46/Vps4 family AAA+-type ATPase